MDLERLRRGMEKAGVAFARGLTELELGAAEGRYGFSFPPDLREFLSAALPIGGRFPNWRELDDPGIARALAWPFEGLCFDIQSNAFWPREWGERPVREADALAELRRRLDTAPRLVPIVGHRYLPDRPSAAGNPVVSVYQSDIIYYGACLEDYLSREFGFYFGPTPPLELSSTRKIEFWSWLVELNG